MRALAVITACLLLCGRAAHADATDTSVRELQTSRKQKIRLAAVLGLSKSKDPRAVIAVSGALARDPAPTIRRVAAIALEKMIDAGTAPDARALAFEALDRAARGDKDAKVKEMAATTQLKLAAYRTGKSAPGATATTTPTVFVNVDRAIDQSKKAPKDAPDRLARVVRKTVERTGYSTNWPGGLPTGKELAVSKARGFIVASTVERLDVTRGPRQTTIACTVAIRVAPWTGRDGGEKWEANRAASASGSAKAVTGNSVRDIASGMSDCLEAVAEDVTNRQVVPFLKRIAKAD